MSDLKKSAARIKSIRLKLGLSMQEFAEKIDDRASRGTISNWENAANQPNARRMRKIAELGGVDIAYLRGETDTPIHVEWDEPDKIMSIAANNSAQKRALSEELDQLDKLLSTNSIDDVQLVAIKNVLKGSNQDIKKILK